MPPRYRAGFLRRALDFVLVVRRVAARQVDFVEERVRPVFAAIGFGADAVFEPAVASRFEGDCSGVDGLGSGYGEAGEERFEGDHVGGWVGVVGVWSWGSWFDGQERSRSLYSIEQKEKMRSRDRGSDGSRYIYIYICSIITFSTYGHDGSIRTTARVNVNHDPEYSSTKKSQDRHVISQNVGTQ